MPSDPNCTSLGCLTGSADPWENPVPDYPIDYPVPDLGMDHDIKATHASIASEEKRQNHKWTPKLEESIKSLVQ